MIGVGFVAVVVMNLISSAIFWFNDVDMHMWKLPYKAKYLTI